MHTRSSRREARAVALAASSSGNDGNTGFGMGYHWTLESAVEFATDVVVAEFVERRPFGQTTTEYEFIVHERIVGNAADTIFVYVFYNELHSYFANPAFQFTTDTQYLLAIRKLANVYAHVHDDGYTFTSNLILDLNNPSRSTLYSESLSLHSDMNFDSDGLTREHIISYVRTLPLSPSEVANRVFITSEYLVDIITGSPHVLVIEINEPRSLAHELLPALQSDLLATDIYYTTIIEVLKGNMQVGDTVPVVFFADTVFTGETHIVSLTPVNPSSPNPFLHQFTSSNSLHCITQRDEIIRIIRGRRSNTDPIELPTPTPTPSPTPSPTPEPEPSPTPEPEDFVAEMLQLDDLNDMFLHEEMHSIAVLLDGEDVDDILSIVSVYVGDLDLSDVQMLMLRGFVIDPDTGDYTVIPGSFSADRDYFHFEFTGSGIIGAVVYELPTPLLRLNINEYRYYYRGSPLTSDVAPFITGNRTMVPIRLVSEALGATPRWDRGTRTAYIYYNDTVLRLPVGEPLPGEMGTPLLRNNRVLVPLRFVIENFDAFTFWDAGLREVTVFVLD